MNETKRVINRYKFKEIDEYVQKLSHTRVVSYSIARLHTNVRKQIISLSLSFCKVECVETLYPFHIALFNLTHKLNNFSYVTFLNRMLLTLILKNIRLL